jgi:hypothetical protein
MWTLEIGDNLAFALVGIALTFSIAWYGRRNR